MDTIQRHIAAFIFDCLTGIEASKSTYEILESVDREDWGCDLFNEVMEIFDTLPLSEAKKQVALLVTKYIMSNGFLKPEYRVFYSFGEDTAITSVWQGTKMIEMYVSEKKDAAAVAAEVTKKYPDADYQRI